MCVIVIAINSHPRFPLIIAGNRDEFYSRPTAPLGFWQDHPDILAGRDLQSHGTWLGVSRKGKIAAVTNYRDPSSLSSQDKSRGELVKNYLTENKSPDNYLAEVKQQKKQYSGFNLLAGDFSQLWWYSNKAEGIKRLCPGIHAVSNHLLNTPWPKTQILKQKVLALTEAKQVIEPYEILDLLYDPVAAPDELLPDTGVGTDWERTLSPIFVISPAYGTRSSSVILVDREKNLVFCERTFNPGPNGPEPGKTRCFELKLP